MSMHPQGGVANRDHRPNAGIDVSKPHLDVCLGAEDQRLANDAKGWDALTAKLKEAAVDLVVIEPTGGYERDLLCALQRVDITVARVNPWQARDFAKSMGVLAKTIRSTPASCATLPMCWRATRIATSTLPHSSMLIAWSWPF